MLFLGIAFLRFYGHQSLKVSSIPPSVWDNRLLLLNLMSVKITLEVLVDMLLR